MRPEDCAAREAAPAANPAFAATSRGIMLEMTEKPRFDSIRSELDRLRHLRFVFRIFNSGQTRFFLGSDRVCLGSDEILTRIRHGLAVGPAVRPAASQMAGGRDALDLSEIRRFRDLHKKAGFLDGC